MAARPSPSIEIFAPARLHLGFLDLNGGLGRKYGSIGVAIADIGTRLALSAGDGAATGPDAARAAQVLRLVCDALGLPHRFHIAIETAIPEHSGLGSGTQLGLAIATAVARLRGLAMTTPALAALVRRGARSGIGIGAFDHGGFLVDGGRAATSEQPPIIARLPVPDTWRFLLTLDQSRRGRHGDDEKAAFAALPPFEDALADRLCRVLVMRLLPGLAEGDFAAVSAAIDEIQRHMGQYFGPQQQGAYSSPAVAEVQAWLRGEGVVGLGQSSWGPTGFALIETPEQGRLLLQAARRRMRAGCGLDFRLVQARNNGAEIKHARLQMRSVP